MGWFDKKSWRLRRKIKDLQADLREAEKEGKFVVEQGLFFAELQDMGEMTMMVFGMVDTLASQEESVIQTFFERNGFTVDKLKLDKTHTHLTEVEIIPPEEFTRAVGRGLRADGYKMIDDSEQERRANMEQRVIPLSSLVRAITVLLAERVQHIISTTSIKMNKEGNRLLRWMPKIVQTLRTKLSEEVIEATRSHFDSAYDLYYGRIGKGAEISPSERRQSISESPTDVIPAINFPAKAAAATATQPQRPVASSQAPPAVAPPPTFKAAASKPTAAATNTVDTAILQQERDAARAMANMYKALVKANPGRCVSNSEALLAEINKMFDAAATCMMVKVPHGNSFTIHAQAGKKLEWGEGTAGNGFAVSASVLSQCMNRRKVVLNGEDGTDPTQSMVMHKIEATAAAPIILNNEIVGILYVDRRGGFRPFSEKDAELIAAASNVFTEFPDLTLGLTV